MPLARGINYRMQTVQRFRTGKQLLVVVTGASLCVVARIDLLGHTLVHLATCPYANMKVNQYSTILNHC